MQLPAQSCGGGDGSEAQPCTDIHHTGQFPVPDLRISVITALEGGAYPAKAASRLDPPTHHDTKESPLISGPRPVSCARLQIRWQGPRIHRGVRGQFQS